MNDGKMIFAQVVTRVPHWEFQRLDRLHDPADERRRFSAWDHLLALAFAQMTFRKSLRDIEACLGTPRLSHHLGFRHRVTRSTLERANEERDWGLFATLAHKLMDAPDGFTATSRVRSLSTCRSMPWIRR